MNNVFSFLRKKSIKLSAVYLASFWLILSSPASALDLQCNLAENARIKPGVVAMMSDAASNGYLYYVDASTSDITFQVNHFPFSTVQGNFGSFQGGFTIPTEPEISRQALFVIKANSISTGDQDLDNYLKSPVFFNVLTFPDIIFVSTGIKWIDKSTARLYGNLTLHGKTKSLVFNMKIEPNDADENDGNKIFTMIASARILRSDFGMRELQTFVSDTVKFNLKIKASRIGS